MSATETGKTGTASPPAEADRHRAAERAAEDAAVSPVVVHAPPEVTSPVPRVAVLRQETAPAPVRPASSGGRGPGVKLAPISRTGARAFRGLPGGSGVRIV